MILKVRWRGGIYSLKAQSSIEFVILVSGVLFFFLFFLFALQINLSDKTREQYNFEIKEIALTVHDEVNLAVQSSDGYSRQFSLPQQILSREYSVNLVSGLVYVRTEDGKFAIALPVANVTGDVQKGKNLIRKVNREVYLN